MGPGSPLAECLTDANLHAPLYLNSEELFSAGMKVLCNGVRRWVCVAVEDGILRQRGEGGGGWEWMWEGRDVQGWVTERVWKDAVSLGLSFPLSVVCSFSDFLFHSWACGMSST